MAFDEFEYVVVGNEPAGLWLLSALEKAHRQFGEQPKAAWICLGNEPAPVALPSKLGKAFDVDGVDHWSVELLTPERSIEWNAKTLASMFPELPAIDTAREVLDSLTSPSVPEMTAVRNAIAKKPELIGFAQGVWKSVGRTQQQLPEAAVHYSRFLTELQWWSPEKSLSTSVERVLLDPRENAMEAFKPRKADGASIRFRNFGEVTSRRWIWNLDMRTLMTLASKCPELVTLLNLQWAPARLSALYPLQLTVAPEAIPAPVPPISLLYDSELIPDPQTEIWPLTLRSVGESKQLTVWANAPGLVSTDAVLDRFRVGVRRVNQLFPFLAERLRQYSVPLTIDTCFDEAQRRAVADRLQDSSFELYEQTSFYTETRSPALMLLVPYLGCNLPYPIGTLSAARRIVSSLFAKRKKPVASASASTASA